jgi:hypothetical protein
MVRVDINLNPPFYKQVLNKTGKALDTLAFMAPNLRVQLFYVLPTELCPPGRSLGTRWCVQDEWQADQFTKPTPYASWTVSLPLTSEQERANISKVFMVLGYTYTDSLQGQDAVLTAKPSSWGACEPSTCTTLRVANCRTEIFGMDYPQHVSFCQYFQQFDTTEEMCCCGSCRGWVAPVYKSAGSLCGRCGVNGTCVGRSTCVEDMCVDMLNTSTCYGYGRFTSVQAAAVTKMPVSSALAPRMAGPLITVLLAALLCSAL